MSWFHQSNELRLVLSLSLTPYCSLLAQERYTVAPVIGLFVSTNAFEGPFGTEVESNNYTQNTAPVLGAAGVLWLTSRVGVGASFAWTPSDVRRGGMSTTTPASVMLLSTFLAMRLTPSEATDLRLRAGVGLVGHLGSALEAYGHPKSLSFLGSMETTLPISAGVRAAGGVDAYFYNFQLTDPSSGWKYEKRFMIDVIARVGLIWTFPGS